ncbi:NAD(P)/FAD-dependent oxidoreductase [Syntrophomonas palmitatica]|uniref:NAD(P)/FAD-dependent oxidoreductase n=1 Tax=Syntrophomonas palmitatica TaxID=402877 RepID=UPI0006D122A8|nr:NAD(P)/FAD-dependent oxidoreductase [Syntrophomonas palmitatica]
MNSLNHLLEPIVIRSMHLSNRVVMPPMGTGLANLDGTVSEANLAYLDRRAKGQAGLIISEITSVHPNGLAAPGTLCVHDDSFIPGLTRMAKLVHKHGCKIAMQLHHAGRESYYQLAKGTACGPSPVASVIYGIKPAEMTREDIAEVIKAFGQAALRARQAQFDAVELHAAHGYLLMQFLSQHSNKRQDEYGGDIVNRARFVIDCLREVRSQVGDDFPVSLRISAEEMIKDGYTIEDMKRIVPGFIDAGADIIHASFGTHGTPGGITSAPAEYKSGFKIELARQIKEMVNVPVIGVGRYTDPFEADEAIARGDADLIAFGRQHLADPDFLINAMQGRPEDTFTCLACNQGCIERLLFEGKSVRCAINPETGQELRYPQAQAQKKRNLWVIGAGPAGLTAASEAARLGHKVTLFEKDQRVGGQVLLAARPPYKSAYAAWIDQLKRRVEKHGARILTGVAVNRDSFRNEKPEYVILASGGFNTIPDIKGADLPGVCEAWSLLRGDKPVKKCIIVIGGGLVGMETADYLYAQGADEVVVLEGESRSPVSTLTSHGYMLHRRLRQAGLKLILGAKVKEIREDGVLAVINGEEQIVNGEQIVLALGTSPNNELREVLEQEGIPYRMVGDANKTGRIIEAVESGAQAAWELD